jgi:Cu/Ag efflux pump CusA
MRTEEAAMLNQLIRWSLHNRALVLVAATLLLLFGIYTAARMPVDVFPDLTAPTVTVITEAHGMSPTEVESQITLPIESSLNGAQHVRRVRSSTAVGLSIVWVEFDWGTDMRAARQTVAERLASVTGSLPSGVEAPVLAPASSIMGEVMYLAMTSDTESPGRLRELGGILVRQRLLSVPGVAQVTVMGGGERQFQAVLNPARLAAHNVALTEVMRALAEGNENVSAGVINQHGSEWLVTGEGRIHSLADISETVVALRDGVPVRVGDLGEVRMGEAPRRGEASLNGRPAVLFAISKQPGANTLELTRQLDAAIAKLQGELPPGTKLHPDVFRQADFIEVAVRNVETALVEGVALVILVVLLFLANVRATLITITAIPLSLLSAVLVLEAFGATINTMTLGGMAIAIGALVDDAVIDVENVFRRLREWAGRHPTTDAANDSPLPFGRGEGQGEGATSQAQTKPSSGASTPSSRPAPDKGARSGESALSVVLRASIEIRSSIVFATLIIALVFVPIFFLSGVEGRLLRPLGVAYLVALFASLFVAVTVTPALCLLLLPRSRAVQTGHEAKFARWLKARYAPWLESALNRPWRVTLPALAALLLAVAAMPFFGRAFLPEFNEGSLTISAVTLPGTSLSESDALGRRLEETLLTLPEVVSVSRRTGRAEQDEHAQGVESAELDVALRMRDRSKAEFLAALREALAVVPGMNLTIGQPISHRIDHMLSGTRANLAVKIFGPDLRRLRQLGEQAQRAMAGVRGVVDLSLEQQMEVPNLRVHFDRPALARHGLTVREVSRTLEAAVQGAKVTTIIEGTHLHDLVVRLDDHARPVSLTKEQTALLGLLTAPEPPPAAPPVARWQLETLGDLLVDTPAGARVPLRELGEIIKDTGPNAISREQVERKIVVSCNVAGRDIASVVRDCEAVIAPLIAAAPGYRVEYGGQFESAASASRILVLVGLAVVVGIGFLLHLAFRSARDAALVMLNLPLALIGGVAGVFLGGGVLSVASLIGFITVFGIATRNGIMLVSHIRHLREHEGVTDFREAVRRGAMERLVPILMTALAAGLALIPLALGGEKPGNEIQTPMAIVILFGLLTSMVLNMLIVPAMYLRFGRPAKPNVSMNVITS